MVGQIDVRQTNRKTELEKPLMQIQFRSPQQLHIMRRARFRTWQPSSGRGTSPLVPWWMRCYTSTLFHLSLLGGNTNIYALTIPVRQLNWNHIFRSVEAASNKILTAWFFLLFFFWSNHACIKVFGYITYKNLAKCNQHSLIPSYENQYGIYKV